MRYICKMEEIEQQIYDIKLMVVLFILIIVCAIAISFLFEYLFIRFLFLIVIVLFAVKKKELLVRAFRKPD